MQINLDEILGGECHKNFYIDQEPSEKSYISKPRNNKIALTSQSYSEEGNTSKQSLLYLDDNIWNMEEHQEDQVEFSERSIMEERSQTSIRSSLYTKVPGERLFNQSKAIDLRRQLEIEEKNQQERRQREGYFAPKINQQSKMLKSKYTAKDYNPAEIKKIATLRKNEYEKKVSDKLQKQVNLCTFKPTINNKKTNQLTKTRSSPAFQHLYHASKIQLLKKQNKILEQQLMTKHQTKPKPQADKAFDNFLQRNQQFKQKQKNKLQLLDSKFNNFDSDGQKLFTPKISSKKQIWKTSSGLSSATGSTPNKQSPSLKDLNQMLLNRLRKVQPNSEPFQEITQEREQYD